MFIFLQIKLIVFFIQGLLITLNVDYGNIEIILPRVLPKNTKLINWFIMILRQL